LEEAACIKRCQRVKKKGRERKARNAQNDADENEGIVGEESSPPRTVR
jgi:hypothetical protein